MIIAVSCPHRGEAFEAFRRSRGEWLTGTGPESDIVMSTRVRLARNVVDYPFLTKANARQCSRQPIAPRAHPRAAIRSSVYRTRRVNSCPCHARMAGAVAASRAADHPAHTDWVKVYEKVRVPGTSTFDIIEN